jgi:glycosyltransferase involved in cell wall biosynthesis
VDVFHRDLAPKRPPLALHREKLPRGERFALNVPHRFHREFRELYFADALEEPFRAVADERSPGVVHVHHLAGLSLGYLRIAKEVGARVVLTLHDYFLACPRGQRIRPDLDLCRAIDRHRCAGCVHPLRKNLLRGRRRLSTLLSWIGGHGGARILEDLDHEIRGALEHVDAFIAPSQRALEIFREFYPGGGEEHVLPHGLPPVQAPPRSLLPGDRPLRVGFIGSLMTTKGIQVLDAAARLLDPGRFSFHVHGTPAKIAALRPPMRRLRSGPLRLHGPYPPRDLRRILDGLDVIVIPSLWEETFSLALREAWQMRLPAVVSDIGALGEAAGDDERALRVAPGDPAALAAALRRLAADPDLHRRLTGPFAVDSVATLARRLEPVYGGAAAPRSDPRERERRS